MSSHAGSASNAAVTKARTCREIVTFRAAVAIGASGAASEAAASNGDNGYDDPGVTLTKSGTGIYALTFPKGRRAFLSITLYSPALTVVGAVVTALDANAGTATIKFLAGTDAAAATEPASGDVLYLTIAVVP